MRNNTGNFLKYIGIYVGLPLLLVISLFLMTRQPAEKKTKYSDIVGYFLSDQVKDFDLDLGNGKLQLWLRNSEDNKSIKYTVPDVNLFILDIREKLIEIKNKDPESIVWDYKRPSSNIPILLNILPTAIIVVGMIVLWFFMFRRMGSAGMGGGQMTFGKARVKLGTEERRKTTFADVAGADEEKEELVEVVDFLKNRDKFHELGARIPKGILLVGPPGTGKTLLARAVAGEAGVPFFSISGSDFVEMYVGVGASRVRDLFDQAKRNAPCIVFIDEIDAVGRRRGAGLGGGHDEREQTLNQLLVEMDGFGINEGVIVMAATNRADILDPALMRPGRFDRLIKVGLPDIKGREEILKVHAKGKPLAADVDLATIAKTTVGFTGADLENLLNEAALLAARKNLKAITMQEIEEATIKVIIGTEKKSKVVTEKEKKLTSYHEAGHAILGHFLETQDPVHQISIIPRGMAGGYTLLLPENDKNYVSRQEMFEDIVLALGGRVSEALVLDDISTGASNDIQRATKIARSMVSKYGMSEKIGPIALDPEQEIFLGRDFGHTRDYSETTAAEIDSEVKAIISKAYKMAEDILKENITKLHAVAEFLLKYEKMSREQFLAVIEGKPVELDA